MALFSPFCQQTLRQQQPRLFDLINTQNQKADKVYAPSQNNGCGQQK
jgi:hypothetical protein